MKSLKAQRRGVYIVALLFLGLFINQAISWADPDRKKAIVIVVCSAFLVKVSDAYFFLR